MVAGLNEIAFNPSSDGGKGGNNYRPYYENKKVWQISAGNLEGVDGLRKEVAEARRG